MADTTRLYQPSNGTEGECFMSAFCAKCANDTFEPDSGDGSACEILGRTMFYRVTDPAYPTEWRYVDGEPTCTSFTPDAATRQTMEAKAAADAAQVRYDSLARDPVTGRPVIA